MEISIVDDNRKTKAQLIEELKDLRQQLEKNTISADTSHPTALNKQSDDSPYKRCGWLFNILKNFPGAIYQLKMDADGTFSMPYLSEGAEKIFGYPGDVLVDVPVSFDNVYPEDREMFLQSIDESAKNFTNWLCEYRIITSVGDVKWIHGESIPNRIPDGGIVWNGVLIDVTEKKNAEEAIRESELRYRTVADNTYDWETWIAPGGSIVYCSPSVERLTGYSVEEIKQDPTLMGKMIHPDDRTEAAPHLREELLDYPRVFHIDFRIITKDNRLRWVSHCCVPVFDDLKNFIGRRGCTRDITERKLAEEALQKSRANLSALIESTDDIIVSRDRDGRAIVFNKAFTQIVRSLFGIEVKPGMKTVDYLPGHQKTHWERVLENVLHGETYQEEYSWDFDGELRHYDTRLNPIRSGDQIIGSAEFTRDFTERKRKEDMLSAQIQLIEYAADHTLTELLQKFLDEAEILTYSQIGFYHFLEDDQKTLSLQTWSTNTLNNMCKADDSGLHYPISKAGVWVDCVRKRRPVIHNDYVSLANKKGFPEGHAPVVRELVVPVFRKKKIVAILGVGNKINNYNENDVKTVQQLADLAWETIVRKQTEEALRENEKKFRTLYNETPVMRHSIDRDGRLINVSNFWLEKTGYTRDEVIGKKSVEFLTEDSQKKTKNIFSQFFRDGYIKDVEYQLVCRNGKIMDILHSAIAENNEQGDFVSSLAVMIDITELKKVHRELFQAKEELEIRAKHLEELNTALKVILDQREEEKIQFENQILNKIKILIKPYLEKLKREQLTEHSKTIIDIIEQNCKEIFEPLAEKKYDFSAKLSPVEFQIADLIKSGKSSKEIADLHNISESTVFTHRKHIRKKLGLRSSHFNLSTFLQKK